MPEVILPAIPKKLERMPRAFYLQPTLRVAAQLIGKYLVRREHNELLIGRIVEVEGYLGDRDPASHSYKGKTRRNEVMFREGGHLYVYFTYGMHFCSNVVTEREGIGRAVLLRAVEPIAGLQTMAKRRNISLSGPKELALLCSGPARLCEAFGIARDENGIDLCVDEIWIAEYSGTRIKPTIKRTARVGISNGREHQWRFLDADSPFVSNGRPS